MVLSLKRFLRGLLTGIALVTAALMLSACDSSPDFSAQFPEKTGKRIELRPDAAGEDIRYVYMADDGKTKTLTQIEHRNGVTSYVFHRPDGTAKEIKDFYPAVEGETARQLKSQVSFDTDGKSYLSHTTFRADGSMERQGERADGGQYRTRFFFDDGTTLNKLQVFDSGRRLLSADSYYKNGSLASQSRRTNPSELVTKHFSEESGKLTSEFTEGRMDVLSGVFYNADGSVRVRFMDSGWKLNSQYFDKGELLALEVEYLKDSMEVASYGPGGEMLQRQIWNRMGENGEECTAAYKLFKVEGFWQQSSDKLTYTRQTIEMNDSGTAAASVETITIVSNLRDPTVKMLHPDGSVAFVKKYREDILISERPGTDADRVDIKALTVNPAFECLPIPSKAVRYRAHSSFI